MTTTATQKVNVNYLDQVSRDNKIVLLLNRFHQDDKGTNGRIIVQSTCVKVCNTIELPWKNNERRISCIPTGRYKLTKRWSQRFKHHIYINNVEGRSFILFHPANYAQTELLGCIAPVTTFKPRTTGIGFQSVKAFNKLKGYVYALIDMGFEVELLIQDRMEV